MFQKLNFLTFFVGMGVSKADLLKKFAPWKACVEFESKLKPLFIAKLFG